ncbi:MFS transporter [Falsibacillus albus]|uniref:MFS transporter n=2 Tax=Falsibacillus albus TaxID=2478915 RepID=A0A3L7JU07_9BACI|nr:MFS transporter [Falsibacillus albus]
MGGNIISFIGDQLYLIALPIMVLKISGSPLSMGVIAAVERFPIVLQPLMGVLADRWNRKRILLVCDFGRAVVMGLMGTLYLMDRVLLPELFVAALVIGVLSQIYHTSQFASIPDLVQTEDIQAVNAINTGAFNSAVLIGPALGGLILSYYNPGVSLLMNAFSYILAFCSVLVVKIHTHRKKDAAANFLAEVKEGFIFVSRMKPILYTNMALLFSVVGTTMLVTMIVIHLKETMELTPEKVGILLSISGGGAIAGALMTSFFNRFFKVQQVLFASSLIGGISIIIFGLSSTFISLMAWNVVGMICAAVKNPFIATMRQSLTPAELLGRVQATSRFMTWLLMPPAALVSGLIAQHFGTHAVMIIGGSISTIASFFFLHKSLRID